MAFVALPVASPLLAKALVGFVPALGHALFGTTLGLVFEALRFHAVVEEGVCVASPPYTPGTAGTASTAFRPTPSTARSWPC